MAYWIQTTANNHNISGYKLFYCDYISDINKLPRFKIEGEKQEDDSVAASPCAYGSECICLENGGSKWVLGKATNRWQKLNTTASGSGSSSGGDIDLNIATGDDVDNVLDSVFGDK